MKPVDIINFLKANVEPLGQQSLGYKYRAAAFLTDGTYLPCVSFMSQNKYLDMVMQRIEEHKERPDRYREIVQTFMTGTSIANYYISRVELSPFAWTQNLLNKIIGETVMGYTAFVVEMNDGKKFSYNTASQIREFYDLPDNYHINDIREIYSGKIYSDSYGMESYTTSSHHKIIKFYLEKPFFRCYLSQLDR